MNLQQNIKSFLLKYPRETLDIFAKEYPFNWEDLLNWRKLLNWENLAKNTKLPWSIALFKEFDFELTYHKEDLNQEDIEELATYFCKPGGYLYGIARNNSIPWDVELIDYGKEKIDWFHMNYKWPLEKKPEYLERYSEYIDWTFPPEQWHPKWTPASFKRFAHKMDLSKMCYYLKELAENDFEILNLFRKHCPKQYTNYLLKKEGALEKSNKIQAYIRKIEYEQDLIHGRKEMDGEDVDYVLNNIETHRLSIFPGLKWSPELLEYLTERDDWSVLCEDSNMPFTEELIEKHYDRIIFGGFNDAGVMSFGLSENTKIPWNIDLIRKYKDKWNWLSLSCNESLPWSEELIDAFIDKWEWDCLYPIYTIGFLSDEKLKKYEKHLNFEILFNRIENETIIDFLENHRNMWTSKKLYQEEKFLENCVYPNLNKEFLCELINEIQK